MPIINAFALLGGQEDDDISTLVAHVASKATVVPRPPPPSLKGTGAMKQTNAGIGERNQGRGGRGRGSGRNGLGGDGTEQSVNKYANGYWRSNGGSNGYQQSSGGSNGYQYDKDGVGGNQRNYSGANPHQRNRGIGNGYGRDSNGYAVDERRHGRGGRERVLNKKHETVGSDQIKIENEPIKGQGKNDDNGWEQVNKHHGKGYGRGIQSFKDGENIFRNRIWSSGGDRRGYGRGSGFRGREDHFNGMPQGLSHGKKETLKNFEKKGDNSKEGEGDNSGTKEGNYGNSEHEINCNNSGRPEGNITVATEVSNAVEPGQGKISQETGKDSDESKRAAVEGQNQMTLGEYEQQLLEKRKNLPHRQTTEGKRVIAAKEFESMQQIEKKKEDSVFIKLKAENDKLKRNGGFDKEEKVNKAISIDEFLKLKGGEKRRQQPRRRWHEERGGSEQEEMLADSMEAAPPPCIRDQFQFPVLGGGPLKL